MDSWNTILSFLGQYGPIFRGKPAVSLQGGYTTTNIVVFFPLENPMICVKPCEWWDNLPTSTGFLAEFLNHQFSIVSIVF